jgi:uncharacterized secreted protein with C-terminal beta-propeller domain
MRIASRLGSTVLALVAAGCGNGIPANQAIQDRVALQAFDSCRELEQYIEDTAVLDMRTQMEQSKRGYGYYWGWGFRAMEDMAGAPTAMAPPSGPSAYTTTNTQVAGVDEADFVKNDGTRIFVISGDSLYINRSWPADQLQTTAKVQLEGWPTQMFLDGNNVVVFSQVYTPYPNARQIDASLVSPMWCGYYYGNTVKLTVIDVSDLSAPQVRAEFWQPGHYSNSRRIGSSVRLLMSDSFNYPQEVKWWPEYRAELYQDKELLSRAIDALIAENERIIRAQTIDQWLPHSFYRGPDGQMVDVGYSCNEFHRTNTPAKLGLVSVATLDMSAQTVAANNGRPTLNRLSLIAQSGEVFASTDALYVASRHWWWWPEPGQDDYTYLHKLDITDPTQARYVASGGVPGHIVDQFSMDEHNGFFRVATTIAKRVPDTQNPQNIWGRMETTNRVSVLGERSGRLEVVGRSEDLATGERIFSSRFIGDKGYVVTFRQVDPLYTFDLSDPTNPRRVGELKIPGFSTYIHPVDANTLLTIGVYQPENPTQQNWRERRLQLSLFDVSDFANPVQTYTQQVGTAWGWSEAMHEHKAFNFFPARKLLAIPFWDYSGSGSGSYWDYYTSELRVFGVDPATGFSARGAVNMKDIYMTSTYSNWSWYWRPAVRRSVMADDYVYAISDAGIRVSHVSSLSTPIKTVLFDRAVVGDPPPIR